MSSSQNEPLTKKEQEEEELRNELAKAGIKDDLSVDEMQDLLKALKESENSFTNNSSSTPKNDFKSTLKILDTTLGDSKMTVLNNSNKTSVSNDNGISSFSEEQSRETSPESFQKKNLDIQSKLNDFKEKESPNEKNYTSLSSNDYPLLRSPSNFRNTLDGSKQWPRENKKMTAAMKKKLKLERYKIDPFKYEQNKDVAPLQSSQQSDESSNMSNDIVDDLNSEKFDELYNKMKLELDKLHELFSASDPSTGDENSEWGLPIKVATKWNGWLDKNPVVEKIPASNNQASGTQIIDNFIEENPNTDGSNIQTRNTRATKRKALENISTIQSELNDNDSDEDFVDFKNKKPKKTEVTEKKLQEEKKKDPDYELIDIDDQEFKNTDLHSLRRIKKQESTNTNSIEESNYPRRITPPNPNKKKSFRGPRGRKKGSTLSQSKKNLGLDDEEISKTLEEIDAEIDENFCEITEDIKPLPIVKNINQKLNRASSLLETAHKKNEQKIREEEEEKKKKITEEKLKKEKMISERIQKREDELNQEKEREKKVKDQENLYRNVFKKKITRSNYNKPNYSEEVREELLLADDNDDELEVVNTNHSSKCPICQNSFPNNQIESHASECNLFSDEMIQYRPSTSRNTSVYECMICNYYRTEDGNAYEEHAVKCKQQAQDRNGRVYS